MGVFTKVADSGGEKKFGYMDALLLSQKFAGIVKKI
jgi:hypothetical protein